MTAELDYPTWVASKLPDVTYDRDAGGVWRYWESVNGVELYDADEGLVVVGPDGETAWKNWGSLTRESIGGYLAGQYRRPIPRPTERLLEAMRRQTKDLRDCGWWHPLRDEQAFIKTTAEGWLPALESSCQAEPGDGKLAFPVEFAKQVSEIYGDRKAPSHCSAECEWSSKVHGEHCPQLGCKGQPVPQEMGEEWDADLDEYRHGPSGSGPHADTWADKPHRLVYDLIHMVRAARQTIASLQQQVADLERRHGNQKAWIAEFFQCLDGLGVTVGVEKCRDHKQIRQIVTDLQQQVRSESAKGSKEAWDLIESSIRASAKHLGIEIGDSSCPIYQRVTQVFDRLQQQVAGLTARDRRAEHLQREHAKREQERNAEIARATAAEAERDRLREICELLKTWWDREDAGSGIDRDKEGGERLWWEWWKENCRLCDEVKTKLDAALSPAESGVRE